VQRKSAITCNCQQKDCASTSKAASGSCVVGHLRQHGCFAIDTSASWLTTSLNGQSSRSPATGGGSNWYQKRPVVATPLQRVGHCIRQRICLAAMARRSTSALPTSQPAVCMLAWPTMRRASCSLWNLAAHMVRIVAQRPGSWGQSVHLSVWLLSSAVHHPHVVDAGTFLNGHRLREHSKTEVVSGDEITFAACPTAYSVASQGNMLAGRLGDDQA
jgi:hypothetical protein